MKEKHRFLISGLILLAGCKNRICGTDKKGIPVTGTESYDSPVVTAGGPVAIAAARDKKIRAFDKKTGKVVWEHQLPAGGYATPVTYKAGGKQYLAIAAGGARGGKPGGWYIAFTLK